VKPIRKKPVLDDWVVVPRQVPLVLPEAKGKQPAYRARAMVFEDPKSRVLYERLQLLAPSDANVLIIGETGTGKELVARRVHELSKRQARAFVPVNCGAFAESLAESELFGHEKGAFTGAVGARAGWFEEASGGTIFLDEIGDLPLPLQVKLLRVIQERQVVRVGSRQPLPVDVRIVAATNVNLQNAVEEGRFREDLYYRLSVATLQIEPLRNRRGDIPPLVTHFLHTYGERLGLVDARLEDKAAEFLKEVHLWPGNIRELENVIHHALLVCRNKTIRREDLLITTFPVRKNVEDRELLAVAQESEKIRHALNDVFERGGTDVWRRIERAVYVAAYDFCHRNQVQTALLLGLSRNIVRARLLEYGLLAGKS
jgi:sigma-54 dependent transcriptional regulator